MWRPSEHTTVSVSDSCLEALHTFGLDLATCGVLGRSSTTTVLAPEPGLVLVVPDKGTRATAQTSRETVDVVMPYLRDNARRAVGVVLVDHLVDQDRGARLVHTTGPASTYWDTLVLVGATPLAQALMAFFKHFQRAVHRIETVSDAEVGLALARRRARLLQGGL